MRKLPTPLILALTLILSSVAMPQPTNRSGLSTLDESRFVELTHKLERNPLDRSLDPERNWAIKWLIEGSDIHASVCTAVLGDFLDEKEYKYSPEIVAQLTLSGAAFTIENPTQAADKLAQYKAGVTGVINAYQAILKQKPNAHSKSLDDLANMQASGKLGEFVCNAAMKCKESQK